MTTVRSPMPELLCSASRLDSNSLLKNYYHETVQSKIYSFSCGLTDLIQLRKATQPNESQRPDFRYFLEDVYGCPGGRECLLSNVPGRWRLYAFFSGIGEC